MSERFENKVSFIPDEEVLYRLQLQIQARQIDQQRRKDEVAAQYSKYEDQIKHLFVTLNTFSKRIWILINSNSYIEYYDILRYQNDYSKIEVGQVFQKITNYLLTPKMDINSMLGLCENKDKCLQLPRFIYLLSLFCYLYSNEMASLFVDFFLQINSEKIEAFTQCFLVNPSIQIYFKTALKPIFTQFRKSQRKEPLFKTLLDSLSMFSPLIPKFFIKLLKKSEFRSLIFYRILKTFLSFFDAFGIASSEITLYYKTQVKGISKMARKYFTTGGFDDFIVNALLSKKNIEKNCSFVPHESAIKKIFPYLYRPFILVDKMSLSNLNLNSEYLYVYLAQSQEEISIERNKYSLNRNQDVFDEMVEINKITKKSNFDSNSIFLSKSNSDINLSSSSNSQQKLPPDSSSDSFFYSTQGQSSEQIKIARRDDDIDNQENRKIARKLYLRIAQRFLSKANLVKIISTQNQAQDYNNQAEIGKRTIFLFKKIAELSSVSKNPDLEIEIDKLEIILNKYPMSINDLASLFEENDYSTVINSQRPKNIDIIEVEETDDDDDNDDDDDDGLSSSALSSMSTNPLFALSLYGKQYMMLTKILVLIDDINKSAYESAIFRMILENSKFNVKNKSGNSYISNPPSFFDFYRNELKRIQTESTISKIFDQKNSSKVSSPPLSPSPSSSLLSMSELPYKSLFLIALYEAGIYNRKEYPDSVKKYDKQIARILSKEDGRNSFMSSLDADKSTKIFFEDPTKLQPFVDQLKIVLFSKSAKIEINESDYKIKSNLNKEENSNYTASSEELIFLPNDKTSSNEYVSSNDIIASSAEDVKSSSNSHSEANHIMIILGLMISNMDRAVMILTELLNANGAKESGMDQYLPLTVLGIIYASPPNLHSVIYFFKNFVAPLLDGDTFLIFSNHEKFNLMLLHSALLYFDQKQNK